jgi:hypothetical protein
MSTSFLLSFHMQPSTIKVSIFIWLISSVSLSLEHVHKKIYISQLYVVSTVFDAMILNEITPFARREICKVGN